jgi:hypothetical protein
MICPNCKEPKAHRSHRDGVKDWLMRLVNKTPYRCHACRTRFYVYRHGEEDSTLRTPEEQRIIKIRRKYKWKQSKRQLLAFGLSALLLIVAIYFILQVRVPPSD